MSGDNSIADARASIFVSYSRSDRDRVLPVITALCDRGHSVWWDGLLEGGDRFSQVTETALETSDVVLVVWTRTSINSHWVRDEATRGRDRGRMVSVSLDGTEPPLGFRQIQYIDLSGSGDPAKRSRFAEVTAALDKVEDKAGTDLNFGSAGVSSSTTGLSRRNAIFLAGGGFLAAGAGVALWRSGLVSGSGTPGSVAVMTFEDLTGGPGTDYLSAGLSEELRAILSRHRQLAVAAQTSSDKFKESDATAGEIASALGVQHVLEGSVRSEGDELRVAARLIDGTSDLDVWSDVFSGQIDNVLSVQSEIATLVVDSLLASFSSGEIAGTERIGGTDNPEALNHYLRGTALYQQISSNQATDEAALAALDDAIALDPQYAAAHAYRARVLTALGNRYASGETLASYYERAMEAARRSIELEPDLAQGYDSLGSVLANGKLDLASAKRPYERSFELGYGNADILTGYTFFASYIGEFDDGRAAIARAERLDPLNAGVFRADSFLEFAARDYPAAAAAARRALSLTEGISIANRILGDIARYEGRLDDARELYAVEPSTLSRLPSLAILEAQEGNRAAADQAFAEMVDAFGDNSLYQQAQVQAQWGQAQEAIATLERALDAGDAGLVLSRSDQNLDPIRHDATFVAIQKRLGFE
ncbi:TIR domain-containing protein [Qipengyuania sp. S6317L1]|uniref:TIR domain-containing protein n=1 Tax=Qipengyuania sp. S6317L1 TaxID=2926410 RepID=UPI001FF1E5B5|nr:TIR domain-containing protein [Qipengyuania sp. S6317L1]